jgi:cell division protein FtsB
MSQLQKTHKTMYAKLGTLLLVAVCCFLAFKLVRSIVRYQSVKKDTAHIKQKYETLLKTKASLQKIEMEAGTPFGVEKTLRETYGYALPGEEVIVVVDDEVTDTSETDPSPARRFWGIID